MPQVAACIVALAIGYTAWGMVPDLFTYDPEPDTYHFVLPYVFDCDPLALPERDDALTRNPAKWWLNCVSYKLTGNYKLIPATFGIAIMPLVYLLGTYMTNDRLIGYISLIAFLNNPLYTDWATSGTYDQVWAFFAILSLVFLFRNRVHASILSLIGAFAAKAMAVMYFPVYLYTVWKQTHDLYYIMISLLAFSVIGFIATSMIGFNGLVGNSIGFFPERWEDALYRNISIFWQVIPFAVFIVINRTFIPKTKMPNQRLVGLWMLSIFLINPVVYLFTMQDTYSYRYVPFAALMSVFVGMTLVNLGNWVVETRLKSAGFINTNPH